MDRNVVVLLGMAGFAMVSLAAFTVYRWWQRGRVRRIKAWVSRYLSDRYGVLPGHLNINCSDDPLWPVLVGFDHPTNGMRHSLQFACAGRPFTYSLTSETDEPRGTRWAG
jgi:hypothetical protein